MRPRTFTLTAAGYPPLIETEVLRGTDMKQVIKAILTTTSFALALSISLASLSTAAQAYAYFGD